MRHRRSFAALITLSAALSVLLLLALASGAALSMPAAQETPQPSPTSANLNQPTLDAIVDTLFQQTAAAQTAMPVTQTVDAAFQRAQAATAAPGLTATAEALQAVLAERVAFYAALPQTRTADGGFVLGEADAPVTIVEFADFACPYCIAYHPTSEQFVDTYVANGAARFEYRMFPTAGGQLTAVAGQIAECAEELVPGGFWHAYTILNALAASQQYTQALWQPIVDQLGLDVGELQTCIDTADQVFVDAQYASSVGVTGTPAIMVRYGDGEPQWIELDGVTYDRGGVPFEVLVQVVEAASATAVE